MLTWSRFVVYFGREKASSVKDWPRLSRLSLQWDLQAAAVRQMSIFVALDDTTTGCTVLPRTGMVVLNRAFALCAFLLDLWHSRLRRLVLHLAQSGRTEQCISVWNAHDPRWVRKGIRRSFAESWRRSYPDLPCSSSMGGEDVSVSVGGGE